MPTQENKTYNFVSNSLYFQISWIIEVLILCIPSRCVCNIPSKQIEIIQSNATMYFDVKIKDYIKSNT
jgi:hypothetical protein